MIDPSTSGPAELLTARHAPAEGYLPFARTCLESHFPGTADAFLELAQESGWPLLDHDETGVTIGKSWPGLDELPWRAEFAGESLARFVTPIGTAGDPRAAAALFTYALGLAQAEFGLPMWTGGEHRVRGWQGVSGSLLLAGEAGELRLEFVPHSAKALALQPTWEGLRAAVAAEVGRWANDDCMIFAFGGENHYCVQLFQAYDIIQVEISGLDSWLGEERQARLVAEGWLPPDPPNWFAWRQQLPYQPGPAGCAEVADLVVHALRELCEVDSPAVLEIQSFNTKGRGPFEIGIDPGELGRATRGAARRDSTIRLMAAATDHAAAQLFPQGVRVATSYCAAADRTGEVGADVIVWRDGAEPMLFVLHVVAPGADLAVKWVPDPLASTRRYARASQGTGPYLRYVLECDPAVTVALKGESRLRDRLSEHLAAHGLEGVTCQQLSMTEQGKLMISTYGINAESVGSVPLSVG